LDHKKLLGKLLGVKWKCEAYKGSQQFRDLK
jgi:hypothetical protein